MKEICPLGLHECPEFEPEGWCVNAQYCLRATEAWRLYKIFILAHLPPIYLGTGTDTDYEWQKPEYGFKYLNNCDFILFRAADYRKFERLRVLMDKDYAARAQKRENNDEDNIPF